MLFPNNMADKVIATTLIRFKSEEIVLYDEPNTDEVLYRPCLVGKLVTNCLFNAWVLMDTMK